MINGLVLAALLCSTSPVLAASITFTALRDAPAIVKFIAQLQALRPQDTVEFVELARLKQQPTRLEQTLVILDQSSFEWRNQLPDGPPTVALRFNHETFTRYQAQGIAPKISFLLSDPPLERQLTLAKLLQPHIRRVGLLHPENAVLSQALFARARALNVTLVANVWPNAHDRRPLLDVLEQNDLLLGFDSEALYNPSTIKNILLTSYGLGKALIGPTLSYVQAGSLASTYSDTQDWLLSLNDCLDRPPRTWPQSHYPQHFKVRLNTQVARALGISLPAPSHLQKRLAAWEDQP